MNECNISEIDKNKSSLDCENTKLNKIVIEEDEEESDSFFEEIINKANEQKIDEAEEFDKNVEIRNGLDLAQEMSDIIKHISYAKIVLREELSTLDKAQEDLFSKIENDKFNVVDGYRLVKEIKEIRIKRRVVKNNLFIYETLNSLPIPSENVIANLITREQRKGESIVYKPRVLKDIDYKFNDNQYVKFKDIRKEELLCKK